MNKKKYKDKTKKKWNEWTRKQELRRKWIYIKICTLKIKMAERKNSNHRQILVKIKGKIKKEESHVEWNKNGKKSKS